MYKLDLKKKSMNKDSFCLHREYTLDQKRQSEALSSLI